jgi:hypothetical protein
MVSFRRRNPVVAAALVAGLLAVAVPANAGACVGHPADKGADAHRAPGPAQLQDLDTEI